MNHYTERDIIKQGGFYTRHVSAMTREKLHSKSGIAAELAHRDIELYDLRQIAAHVPAATWIKAKEAAGYGEKVSTHVLAT